MLGQVVQHHLLSNRRDPHQPGLAPVALDVVVGRVAEPAVHLHRGVRGRGGGSKELGYVRLLAARLVVRSPVDPPGCSPDDQFRGSEPGMSSGERERDALVSAARTTEDHPSADQPTARRSAAFPTPSASAAWKTRRHTAPITEWGPAPRHLGPKPQRSASCQTAPHKFRLCA